MSSAGDLHDTGSEGGSSGINGDGKEKTNEGDATSQEQHQRSSSSASGGEGGQADDGPSENSSNRSGARNSASSAGIPKSTARSVNDGQLTLLASDSASSLLHALFPSSSADELSHRVDDNSIQHTTRNTTSPSAEACQEDALYEGQRVSSLIKQAEKEILKSSSVSKREVHGSPPKPKYEHDSQQNSKGASSIAGKRFPDELELTKAALRHDAQSAQALGAIPGMHSAGEAPQRVSFKGAIGLLPPARVSLPAAFPTADAGVDPSGPGAFSTVQTGEVTRTLPIRKSLMSRHFAASASAQPPQQPREEGEGSRQELPAPERVPGAYPSGGSSELPPVRYSGLGRSQHSANTDRDLEGLEESAPAGEQEMEETLPPALFPSQELMEADPITDSQAFLPEAQEVQLEDFASSGRRKAIFVAGLTVALVLLAAIITAVIVATVQLASNDNRPTLTDTPAPTQASMMTFEGYVKSLLPNSTLGELRLENSPQSRALRWLLQDPSGEEYEPWRIQQRFALATIYYAMDGDGWTDNKNWLSYNHHECTWYSTYLPWYLVKHELNSPNAKRVWDDPVCYDDDGQQHYQHLKLYLNALKGTIPLEIFLLTSLKAVHMLGNKITGTLSSGFWKLSELEGLALMGNEITGSLPTELGLLTSLKVLAAYANSLSGTIPTELAVLDGLEELYIDTLALTGTIPSEIGGMTSLQIIDLHTNHITGSLPSEIGLLTSLVSLDLLKNKLTGQLPSEMGLLSELWYLDIGKNDLTGTIPEFVYELTNLVDLFLERNAFTGTLSSSVENLWNLQYVYLQGNLLSGTIPDAISGISGLHQLYLNMNAFTGQLTSEIGQLYNLSSFYINHNQFSGLLPSELGLLDAWPDAYLNFAYNNFEGGLPIEFRNLQDAELNISANQLLSGVIPTELCGLQLYFDCSDTLCGCECECISNGTSV